MTRRSLVLRRSVAWVSNVLTFHSTDDTMVEWWMYSVPVTRPTGTDSDLTITSGRTRLDSIQTLSCVGVDQQILRTGDTFKSALKAG